MTIPDEVMNQADLASAPNEAMKEAYDLHMPYSEGKFKDSQQVERIHRALLAAEVRGMERAAAVCDAINERLLSPKFAANQPIGSFLERATCAVIRREITAEANRMKEGK